ncbi:MAG: N-methyl-L-tryptophan oxidase [Verrucomicrobia bacterium]|nr:N-methyl-L-tryptophan oxidase [Verrucomicrobiota bacterium]
MSKNYEVAVIGLGGMGSATVWQLARRGTKVIGFEQFDPVHARGSSHGQTRVIRQAYFEHPAYVPLLLRAYELWRETERESGRQLLTLCGGLMMGSEKSEVVSGSIRSARQHGLGHEVLDAGEIRYRWPQFCVPKDHIALFEKEAGVVRAELSVQTHLELAESHGADLLFNQAELRWECKDSGGFRIFTKGQSFEAGRLILTPGPWASRMLPDIGVEFRVERQVLFWFQPTSGVRHFLPGRFPIYIWENAAGLQPYGFPSLDGPRGGVKIAFFRIPDADRCDPDSVDRTHRRSDENLMRQVMREFLPSLEGPLLHSTVCLYTCTPDLHFRMGLHPRVPDLYFAAGFSGHGFKFCSVVGEILADLATKGTTRNDLSLFRTDIR